MLKLPLTSVCAVLGAALCVGVGLADGGGVTRRGVELPDLGAAGEEDLAVLWDLGEETSLVEFALGVCLDVDILLVDSLSLSDIFGVASFSFPPTELRVLGVVSLVNVGLSFRELLCEVKLIKLRVEIYTIYFEI